MGKLNVFVFYQRGTKYTQTIIDELGKLCRLQSTPNSATNVVLSLQMGGEHELINFKRQHTDARLFTYVWDCYGWIKDHGRGYNWDIYGELCRASDEVWTPSNGQVMRLKEHWNVTSSYVLQPYAQYFDAEPKDGGYVYNPLRAIPDRHLDWIERVCEELNIPIVTSVKGRTGLLSFNDYATKVANCSFVVSSYYEASTGGMTLWEAYNIGKEVLVCNTPYQGAVDYFGDRAFYFEPTYDSLKAKVKYLWDNRHELFPTRPLEEKKEFCSQFTAKRMAEKLYDRMLSWTQ